MREKDCRIILVVGPSKSNCRRLIDDLGLDLESCGGRLRYAHKAYDLRGWSERTPVLVTPRDGWDRTETAENLGLAIDTLLSTGRFRLAQDADIAAIKGEMV